MAAPPQPVPLPSYWAASSRRGSDLGASRAGRAKTSAPDNRGRNEDRSTSAPPSRPAPARVPTKGTPPRPREEQSKPRKLSAAWSSSSGTRMLESGLAKRPTLTTVSCQDGTRLRSSPPRTISQRKHCGIVSLSHITNSVATEHPSKHRRNTSVTALRLYDHWKMMIYCSRYSLLTPRNGRRRFHSPVQIPSMVLQCTSRTPSPSSSRRTPRRVSR